MTDKHLNPAKIDEIATNLNDGHRDAAMSGINLLTANLINGSDYSAAMKKDFAKIMNGDVAANQNADKLFEQMAGQERKLWNAISDAATAKNPHGLCKLTIVEDGEIGPHAEIRGNKCH